MKNTLYSRTKEKVKNNWSSILVTTTVVACTAMVMFGRCGGGPISEGPAAPICGDNVCEQSEAYPYEMGKDRLFKKDKNGAYVLNKSFCPVDCHTGDGKLQDKMDDLRDMAGNKIALQLRPGIKAEALGLPEGQDSIDYRLSMIKEQPCIPGEPSKDTPKIGRPLVSAKPGELIIRPMDEWEQMVKDPTTLPPSIFNPAIGSNSFKRPWLLEETCDIDLKVPFCAPNVNERCYCANHTDCPPRVKVPEPKPAPAAKCKNGKWEKALGEPCDPTDKKVARGGCDPGQKCTNACTCVKESEGPKCGNGKVEEGEDCDPPRSACTTSDGAGTCTSQCVCEVKKPVVGCSQDRLGKLTAAVRNAWNGACDSVKAAVGKDADIGTTTNIHLSNDGSATVRSANAEGKPVSISLEGASSSEGPECDGSISYTIPRCR